MSNHKTPLTELERKGLEAHGLGQYIGKPSQLADVFRQGVAWALANTTPTAQPALVQMYWVGLTEKEYIDVTAQHFGKNGVSWFEDSLPSFVKDVEAKLKEKNS